MSRYTIHQDWCHVSHDGPCQREDQRDDEPPSGAAGEFTQEDVEVVRWLVEYVRGDHSSGYHITAGERLAAKIATRLAGRPAEAPGGEIAPEVELSIEAGREMLAWCEREGETLAEAVRRCRFTSLDMKRVLSAAPVTEVKDG